MKLSTAVTLTRFLYGGTLLVLVYSAVSGDHSWWVWLAIGLLMSYFVTLFARTFRETKRRGPW